MKRFTQMTAELVSDGHPDKFADQVADRILDRTLELCGTDSHKRRGLRTAIECLAKDRLLVVSGEARWPVEVRQRIDVATLAKAVWEAVGYGPGEQLTVIDHVCSQSPDIATGSEGGVDAGGAGDQGIMVGYATDETPQMMPREWLYARDVCMRLRQLRCDGTLPWLRADAKTQVTVEPDGTPRSYIVAAQHEDPRTCGVSHDEMRDLLFRHAVRPILGEHIAQAPSKINGTGLFILGGPIADAGVVGRKIVADAYGPRVPVGGGAYSGKDPTKVDRSAAYMARHIARTLVANHVRGAREALVHIAYGIGQRQPEMVTAVTEAGIDVSGWVRERFPDLSPAHIIERLGLLNPRGWSYFQAASFGHYGRDHFPWEAAADMR